MRGIPADQFIRFMNNINMGESILHDRCPVGPEYGIKNSTQLQRLKMLNISMLKKRNLDLKELMFVLIYKLSDYVGFFPYKLANDTNILNWLDDDVEKIFNVAKRASCLKTADSIEKNYKIIVEMITSAVKKNYNGFDLKLDRKFSEFKRRLSRAISRAKSFIALATKRRNLWISMTCKLYKLDPQDLEIQKLYNYLIANDPATIALERMNNILESAIITKNEERFCRYVFYTCKLSKGSSVDVSKLGSEYDEFKKWVDFLLLPDNIESIINDRDEYTEYFLTEETRKKIDGEFGNSQGQGSEGRPNESAQDVVADGAGEEMNTTRVRSSSVDSKKDKKSPKRSRSSSFGGRSFTRPKSSVIPSYGEAEKPSDASTEADSRNIEKLLKKMVYQYTGDIPFKLYENKEKGYGLLKEDVRKEIKKITQEKSFDWNWLFFTYVQNKRDLTLVNDKNKKYDITLPSRYYDFKKELSKTLKGAIKLKQEIDIVGKVKRDEWLEGQCDLYHLDMNDKRVTEIYTEAIADDPTITTSKRLAGVIEGLNAAIEDKDNIYKHAFYTLKLFSGDTIKQVDIPIGCGLGSSITSAFLMVPEFNAILKEGTLDLEFYMNKETRDTIDKKLKKLAHIDFDIPQGSAGGMTWDDDDDDDTTKPLSELPKDKKGTEKNSQLHSDFNIPQGSAGGMTWDDDDDDAEQAIPKPPSELPKWVIEKMKNESLESSTADSGDERSSEYKKKSVKDIVKELEGKMPSDTTKNR